MAAKNDIKALIVFVDIRGFTVWAENVNNAAILDEFVETWYGILKKNFAGTNLKHLGDGAMIIKEMPEKTTAKLLKTLLSETLKNINKTKEDFGKFCKKLSEEEGTKIDLALGWGIAKGPIKKISSDYIGADINKCSRYCDIARPFGIVIDADDFQKLPALPNNTEMEFSKQTRILKGIHYDCDVWVTKEIAEQFIIREDLRENPEVHIAGICFKKEQDKYFVLLGKRTKNRKLFPLLYEGCGGQLSHNELFHEGVKRHYEKEYHIEVKVHQDIYSLYEINTNNEPKIPGIRFLCEYKSGTPSSLNHIPPSPNWFSETEFKALPKEQFIPGLKDEIAAFFERFKKL
jgi:class 3 adenylate cyclase